MKPGTDADGLAKTEADHFMKCPGSGEWFDMRDLEEVAKHVHDGDFEIVKSMARARPGTPMLGRALPNRAGFPGQVRPACAALSCPVQRAGVALLEQATPAGIDQRAVAAPKGRRPARPPDITAPKTQPAAVALACVKTEDEVMITDGTAFGTALALKHILSMLEQKGIVTRKEIVRVLDGAIDELKALGKNAIPAEAGADAAKAIGLLYIRG
jgi:hypothetical protein